MATEISKKEDFLNFDVCKCFFMEKYIKFIFLTNKKVNSSSNIKYTIPKFNNHNNEVQVSFEIIQVHDESKMKKSIFVMLHSSLLGCLSEPLVCQNIVLFGMVKLKTRLNA